MVYKKRVSFKPRGGSRKRVSFKPRGRKKVAMTVKKYVERRIRANIENKTLQYGYGFAISNYFDDTSLNSQWLSPGPTLQILQGSGQGQRNANRVRIVKATLTYTISPNGYDGLLNPQPRPIVLKIWIGYFKPDPINKPIDFTQFFQSGNTAVPPNNFMIDMLRTVNKDRFVIFKTITHKIGYSSVNGTGAQPIVQYYNNNDFKFLIMRKINITKYLIQNVVYQDNNFIPSTRGLFMWMQLVGADNTSLNNVIAASINYFVDLEYEDA